MLRSVACSFAARIYIASSSQQVARYSLSCNKIHQIAQILVVLVRILIVIFLITGTVNLFKAVFKTVAFDEYPLPSYSYRITTPDGQETAVDEKQIAVERKLQMLEDYSGAITLLLLAGGLYWLMQKKIRES